LLTTKNSNAGNFMNAGYQLCHLGKITALLGRTVAQQRGLGLLSDLVAGWDAAGIHINISGRSRTGKYLAFTMFVPGKATEFGSAPPKPEGANWAPPLEVITDLNYQADGAGRLKPGFTHAFVVAADGGAARQLTFGAFKEAGPISWSPNGEYLYLAGNRDADWVHEQRKTQIYQVSVSNGAIKNDRSSFC
jgi:Tol biopolymer transport system component